MSTAYKKILLGIDNISPDLSGYLPLSGGTMTGAITMAAGAGNGIIFGNGDTEIYEVGDIITFKIAGTTKAQIYSVGVRSYGHVYVDGSSSVTWLDRGGAGFNSPASLRLATTGILSKYYTSGLTASTTRSQGEGALTHSVNEISTVANANDTVTMPTAIGGDDIIIINNGANTLQIFPASGDDLGSGVDNSITLASGSNLHIVSYDATNWEII